MNHQQLKISLAMSTALLCSLAGSAHAAEPDAQANLRSVQVASIAQRTLQLQPGDDQVLSAASQRPIEFVEIPNDRTFTGQLLVHSKNGKHKRATDRVSALIVQSSEFVNEYVVDVPAGMSEGELAAILIATDDYEFVEPNWLRYPAVIPNDSQYNSSWQHTRIQSASAWDLNTGSSDIIVAVCDSGVDLDHPDLSPSLITGYNSASRRTQANGGDVNDINGHGTFVSGCAAAKGNNNRGVVGVGWDFSLMPIRVTNNTNGTASSFDILDGARWAALNGAHVVNASFSGGTSASNNSTGAYLKTLGALLFWASGNDGSFISPNRPDVVIVGSTTSSDNRSGFSNFGPAVDISAPGSSVRSTRNGGTYGNGSGTSYASPIAAGVGAMIYAVNPDFSANDVQDILYNSADDLGAPGRDDSFGRGRVNTRNAIEFAQSYIRPTEAPIAESFESVDWQDLFVATSGSIESEGSAQAPDGSSVLKLDNSDVASTVALAGRSLSDSAVLSFMLLSQSIEDGETLEVQYLENPESQANTWTTLASITGQGLSSNEFVPFDILLPPTYEWHGVKIRFVANGSDSSDVWMIDQFSIDLLEDSIAPLEDNFESGIISATRWESVDGASVSFVEDSFQMQLDDSNEVESRDIPLDQFGIVPAYIRFEASSDNNVSGSDVLLVEVFNIANNWITAGSVIASDLSSSPQLFEFDVPITAIAIPDMQLRLSASTSGSFYVDNVYVGVDQLTGGCSDADFAEPYGSLNFFDISAYLSAFSAQDTSADINNDGSLNFFDISDYLQVFSEGCP